MEPIMIISLMAGLCTALGALLLFGRRNWSNRSLAVFLGLAAGVMTAVVLFDMLPSALLYYRVIYVIGGIIAGILVLYLSEKIVLTRIAQYHQSLIGLGYLIMLGIAL